MDTIRNTLAENFGGAAHNLAKEEDKFSLDQVPDLTGKVAVITGGSEGIGYGCSHTLLTHNISKLFILSLSQEVVDGAAKVVAEELGQQAADKMHWFKCDMGDWPAVTKVASQIASETDRLDIVICCSARGIMTYQLTGYGVDRHMAVNHMGHTILISHLLPLLKKTADRGDVVRVVNLSSNAYAGTPSDCQFAELDELNHDLGPNPQYGRSKLAQLLYARYMNKHVTASGNPNMLFNATHPGFVHTKMSVKDIHEPYPLGGYGMSVGLAPFKKDQFEGCVSTMFAATATKASGQYICPPAIVEPGNKQSQDMELAERLMKLTVDVIKEKTFQQSVEKGCPFSLY